MRLYKRFFRISIISLILSCVITPGNLKVSAATEHSTAELSAEQDQIIQNLLNNMVTVQGGTFTMGATPEQGSDALDNEKPAHQVTLSTFGIGRYEVTQEEWQAVMGDNPSELKGPKHPVENVGWDDCLVFINKLNALTGKKFRLLTEAEWEFAARGGNQSKGYKYSGSNNIDEVAWFGYNKSHSTSHDVGTKRPNELGLYDMSGNVWEWCSDWFGFYGNTPQTNPAGASGGSFRVRRGGSWVNLDWSCRVSNRDMRSAGAKFYNIGMRLALTL